MRPFSWRRVIVLVAIACMVSACGGSSDPASAVASDGAASPLRQASDGSLEQQIIDVYDPATNILTIPLVRAGIGFYKDVQVEIGRVISLGVANAESGVFDLYDGSTRQLTIPVGRIGETLYQNVLVSLGNLVSLGPYVDSYSVPVDLAQVHYPDSYTTVTTDAADINTDPCNLNLSKITYPATWLGQYPLPAIQGAPLKPASLRAVTLKDVGLQPGNPAFIVQSPGAPHGCSGDLQAALAKTVARLHALGTDYVNITQWHWAAANPDGSWYITSPESTFGAITDADLTAFVQKAHAAGLKVIMHNQIQGFAEGNGASQTFSVPPNNAVSWAKWFPAYQAYISERAQFFQSIGIDVWEVGCAVCMFGDSGDGSAAAVSLFHSQYEMALDAMKQHFTGKTLMFATQWLPSKPAYAGRVDIFEQGYYGPSPFPDSLNHNLTAASYRAAVEASYLQAAINLLEPFGKTIMISYGIQSRSDMFTQPGYMEETACTPGFGSFDNSGKACIERVSVTDFSMQAIVHEGTLEAINNLKAPKSTVMVNVLDYWETDSLMPFTAFPNIAYSIRNKPAEGIVKAWFAH